MDLPRDITVCGGVVVDGKEYIDEDIILLAVMDHQGPWEFAGDVLPGENSIMVKAEGGDDEPPQDFDDLRDAIAEIRSKLPDAAYLCRAADVRLGQMIMMEGIWGQVSRVNHGEEVDIMISWNPPEMGMGCKYDPDKHVVALPFT